MGGLNSGLGAITWSEGACSDNVHVYPKTYAGDPQYAAQYFSRCLCGKKRKITTVKETDNPPTPTTLPKQSLKEDNHGDSK